MYVLNVVLDSVWFIRDWTIFTQILLEPRDQTIHLLHLVKQAEGCISPKQGRVSEGLVAAAGGPAGHRSLVSLLLLVVVEVCQCCDAVVPVADATQLERKSR